MGQQYVLYFRIIEILQELSREKKSYTRIKSYDCKFVVRIHIDFFAHM